MAETLTTLSGLGPWLAFGGLAVLALLALILGRRARRRGSHALAAGHRLAVIDQVPIDQTRRLVLIQRDEVQHLVILGGGSDFLVESGIRAGEVRLHAPEAAPRAHHEQGHHEHAPHHRPVFLDEPRREPPAAPATEIAPKFEPVIKPEPVVKSEPVAKTEPLREPASRAAERPAAAREAGSLFRPAAPRRAPAPVAAPAEEPAPVAMPELRLDLDPTAPPRPMAEPAVARPRAPLRTEPRLDTTAPEKPEGGPRVAVKLDPFFAGMVEQLEETLRRPTGNGETARSAQVTVATATVTASTPAPARPVPEMKTVEPLTPVALPKDEPKLLNVAAAKPVGSPPPVAIPAASPPDTAQPSPEARADAPAPVLTPEILPPETSEAAPKAASPDVLAPTAQDRPAAPGDDPFEIEMASLLGRNRRP